MLSTLKQTNCATTLLCVKSICVQLNEIANDLFVELMNELTTTTTKKSKSTIKDYYINYMFHYQNIHLNSY